MSGEDRSLERQRARYAYGKVASWSASWRKEARQRARGLPVQVRTQGLMATLACLLNEDGEQGHHLADLTAEWLLEQCPRRTLHGDWPSHWSGPRRLLDGCIKAGRADYLGAQAEAIALLEQVKRYADAVVGGED